MAIHLVVVESPAKAKTINKYLGKGYKVVACKGHVRDLPKGKLGVDLEHSFLPTYAVLPEKKETVKDLARDAKKADIVYLATDLDREGEAIAWHLTEALSIPPERARRVVFNQITKKAIQAAFAKPDQINIDKVNAQQARRILDRLVGYPLSQLLWRKVAKGLSAGRVQSVAVRLIVEREREIRGFSAQEYWRIGAVLARAADGARATAAHEAFVSTRREKAAELAGDAPAEAEKTDAEKAGESEAEAGLTGADRKELAALLRENNAFRAELVRWGGEKVAGSAEAVKEAKGLVLDAGRARAIVDELRKETFVVSNIEKKERHDRPRPPFTTASIQQAAAAALRFPAAKTMRTAQGLYEGVELGPEGPVALITYMRTDSTFLADEAIVEGRDYIGKTFGKDAVPEKPNHYSSKAGAQGAHEAIRPTEPHRTPDSLRGFLDADQLALYRLIWTRFIACQMKAAVWNVTELDIDAGRGRLRASGRELQYPGYLALTGAPDSAEEQMLPPISVGDKPAAVNVGETRHQTQPPPRFSEASLVKELEKLGIGRPSTYAAIIETIQQRNYVRQQDRRFFANELGEIVTDKLIKHFPQIVDAKFTSEMENRLDEIETAKLDWTAVLKDFWVPFKERLDLAQTEMDKVGGQPSPYPCELCGSPMVYRQSRTGRFLGCTKFPECKGTKPVDAEGKPKEVKFTDVPCPKCAKPMILRSSERRARTSWFLGCSGYPECATTIPCDEAGKPAELLTEEKLKALDIRCPECKRPMALKRGRGWFMGCTGYPECRGLSSLPAGYYVRSPEPEKTNLACDKCGKPMVVRMSRRGKFLSCSGYPRCRNAKPYSLLETGGVEPGKPADAESDEKPTKAKGKGKGKAAAAERKPAEKKAGKGAKPAKGAAKGKAAADAKSAPPSAPFDADDTVDDAVPVTPDMVSKPAPVKAKTAAMEIPPEGDDWGACPNCGKPMTLRAGRFGPFLGCSAFPRCRTVVNLKGEAKAKASGQLPQKPPPEKTDIPCPNCGKPFFIRVGRNGRFLGCSGYPACKTTQPMTEGAPPAPVEGK